VEGRKKGGERKKIVICFHRFFANGSVAVEEKEEKGEGKEKEESSKSCFIVGPLDDSDTTVAF